MLYPLSYEGEGCRILGRERWSLARLVGRVSLGPLEAGFWSAGERRPSSCERAEARQGLFGERGARIRIIRPQTAELSIRASNEDSR
jgi:hypothetical protein